MGVEGAFFLVEFVVVVGIHLQVVERKLLLDALLEGATLFQCERVRFGDDWHDVDNI